MSKPIKIALTIVAVVLTLGAGTAFVAVADDEPTSEELAFIEVLDKYLSLAQRVVDIASRREAVVFLAVEDITEIYNDRGEAAKGIEHLKRIMGQLPDDRTLRTIIRFKLRDLYQETGMTDKALAELDQIITENTR